MESRFSPPRAGSALLGALLILLSGCAFDDRNSTAFYVPIAPATVAPQVTQDPEEASPSPEVDQQSQDKVISPAWRSTCIALSEFKDTYAATFIFSVSLIDEAARLSPSRAASKTLKAFAKSLQDSTEAFSRELASPSGVKLNQKVLAECGEPFLAIPSNFEGEWAPTQ